MHIKNKYLLFIIFILFMGLNSGNLDYRNYEESYRILIHIKGFEYGYFYLQKLFSYIGLNFIEFRFLIYFMCLFFIFNFIDKYTKNITFFCILYFFYPFFLDNIEIRNFIGLTFFLYSLSFLSKKSYKRLFFCVLIIFASLFQNIYIIFLPIYFLKKNSYIQKYVFFTGVIISFILAISPNITIFIFEILLKYLGIFSQRSEYFLKVSTKFGIILAIVQQFWIFFISNSQIKKINQINFALIEKKDIKKIKFIYTSSIVVKYTFLLIFLYRLNGQFLRVLQNLCPVLVLSFLIAFDLCKKYKIKLNFLWISFQISYVIFMFFYVIIYQHYEDIFISFFKNNLLI